MSISILLFPEGRVSVTTSLASVCLRIALVPALAPVFFPGCSAPDPAFAEAAVPGSVPLLISAAGIGGSGIRCLDLFFFNDDRLQRLDAYQRIEGDVPAAADGASRSGRKWLAVLANSPNDRYEWADIRSLDALRSRCVRLQDEDPERPQLSALVSVGTGSARSIPVALKPYSARIEVTGLRCDFSGQPYQGARLEDVRIYLTNVNTAAPVLGDTLSAPTDFVNAGRLQESDLARFLHPEIVSIRLTDPVGANPVRPATVLQCYANTAAETGVGTPPTRLVIEGLLEGQRSYWPVEIGRGAYAVPGAASGIEAGCTYRLDITLTRRGLPDPDGRLEPGTLEARLQVSPWTEQEETVIRF